MAIRAESAIALAAIVASACSGVPRHAELPDSAYVAIVNASASDAHLWENAYCGAALVDPEFVVTATHCLQAGTLPDVVIGVRDLCDAGDAPTRVSTTERIDGSGLATELSLLRLASPAPGQLIPLGDDLDPGDAAIAVGWGRKDLGTPRPCAAKEVALVAVAHGNCRKVVEHSRAYGVAVGATTCMIPQEDLNTCVGDSGGGTYSRHGEAVKLTGITIGGAGCAPEDPGVYISPSALSSLLSPSIGPP